MPRRSPRRRTSRPAPASGSSRPAVSEACTAARRAAYDESADLVTLARVPVTVVCAGVKSILDVPATLERLETLGVGLLGYGTDSFPGFYLSDSGEPVEHRVDSPEEVAAVMRARAALGTDGTALLVANPLPVDEQARPGPARPGAARVARRRRGRGRQRQAGDAVPAGQVPPRDRGPEPHRQHPHHPAQRGPRGAHRGRARRLPVTQVAPGAVVLGDVMTDVVARVDDPLALGSDTAAQVSTRQGGAGGNVAAWLAALGVRTTLVGRVGDDPFGREAADVLRQGGVDVRYLGLDPSAPTGTCVVLVGADGERTMLPDAGANSALRAEHLPELPDDIGHHLHVSGYTLLNPGSRDAGLAAVAAAHAAAVPVSVDAASAAPLEAVGAEAFLRMTAGAEPARVHDGRGRGAGRHRRARGRRRPPDAGLPARGAEARCAGSPLDPRVRQRHRARAGLPAAGSGRRHHRRGRRLRRGAAGHPLRERGRRRRGRRQRAGGPRRAVPGLRGRGARDDAGQHPSLTRLSRGSRR
nr:pseudouridine-5'-phosphate glycosidase [Angustibacter aerolatus]